MRNQSNIIGSVLGMYPKIYLCKIREQLPKNFEKLPVMGPSQCMRFKKSPI